MGRPLLVLVGSSTPIQKILPRILAQDALEVAAIYGDSVADGPTQTICEAASIPFHDMKSLRQASGLKQLQGYHPDWIFNINSMLLFKEELLAVPKQGALNLHCGNLPEYAGKHAHQWAIRQGESEFGVTLHWMSNHIDGGEIVGIRMFPITQRDTGLSLYMKFIKEGIVLVEETLALISKGLPVPQIPQDISKRHYFLDREARDGSVPWTRPQEEVVNFFRAADYAPFQSPTYEPTAYCRGVKVVLQKAKVAEGTSDVPGQILAVEEKSLLVGTGTGPVSIRKWKADEGLNLQVGDVLTSNATAHG